MKSAKICFNCLVTSHLLPSCPSVNTCKTCKGKHHSLLHYHTEPRLEEDSTINGKVQSAQSLACSVPGTVLLGLGLQE